jgi:hypothetical protein
LVVHVPGRPLEDDVGTEGDGSFAKVAEQTLLLEGRRRAKTQEPT